MSDKKKDDNFKKLLVAAVLTVQTTATILVLRYSKTTTVYVSSTAILLAEFVKMFICVAVLWFQHGSSIGAHLHEELIAKPKDLFLLAVPAILYLIQNNLLFFAMECLDAAVYQVTYQLKILTTALCTVLMLDRRLTGQQWFALVLLTCGVALAQFQPASKAAKDYTVSTQSMGIMALLFACLTSGFAGVYTEKLLKQTQASLWIRNIQLAFWSVLGCYVTVYTKDYAKVASHGFFQGWNWTVCFVVLLQAGSGIIIALVMKVADNIIKNFSAAMSILLATIISIPLFGFMPTSYFAVGAVLVLFSVHLYTHRGNMWEQLMEKYRTRGNSGKERLDIL
eukprot:Sspe_Gene.64061::Locus_37435_Transcript_1_1_Confidence_1.000_Length_1303::g.64061::m.64061/K15272/SLC35A1_2_3; solute carrier family 35 (UDP-sugar transporter), member A1/2/3